MQINDGPKTQQIFGIDVDGLKPGQQAFIDGSVFGYPGKSLRKARYTSTAATWTTTI
jgi:hypothetical protein